MKRSANRLGAPAAMAAGVLALVGLSGCSSLELLDENQCGNRVLESSAGEDCDGEAGCAPASSDNACRYVCDPDEAPSCPLGYGCGIDGVCRKPSGAFTVARAETTVTARDLLVGDINRDGCSEAVLTASRSMVIEAFSSEVADDCAASSQSVSMSRPGPEDDSLPPPSLLSLSADADRLMLVAGARGLFGDGLSVLFSSGDPTVTPILYPVQARPGASPRTLKLRLRGKDVALLLEQSQGATKTNATLFSGPIEPPESFDDALPVGLGDVGAIIAADVFGDSAPPETRCDELVVAKKGAASLSVFTVCAAGDTNAVTALPGPPISLDSGATLREKNQALVAVDVDGDGHKDLVMNASDTELHVAYGLGDGRFHSKSPPIFPPDQKTSILPLSNAADLSREDGIFVAGEFDSTHAGVDFVPLACPASDLFGSPTCDAKEGGCEAVVTDIDADGDDDIVSTEEQALDVTVQRRITDGTFHVTYLKTSCPPQQLDAGDLDGDGVADVAFFDQASAGPEQNTTSLSVAYGNAFGDPSAPVSSGRFDEGAALSVARLGPPSSGAELAIARTLQGGMNGSALGIVEIGNERTVVAPFYFPSSSPGGSPKKEVALVAQTAGRFVTSAEGEVVAGLAVITRSSTDGAELWLVEDKADAGSLAATTASQAMSVPCDDACVLAPFPVEGGADRLLLLGDSVIVAYEVGSGAFVEVDRIEAAHSFRSILSGSNPAKYASRPLVGLVDGDALTDVIAVDGEGALIGLFGRADGQFDEQELMAAPSCEGGGSCGALAAAQIDADGDGSDELAIAGPGLLAAYDIQTSGSQRSLASAPLSLAVTPPPDDTDFTALAAADADGDGVKDLFLASSSNFFVVLRGLPVRQ